MNRYNFLTFPFSIYIISILTSLSLRANEWERVSSGIPDTVPVLSLAFGKGFLYAGTDKNGVYYTKDKGKSWTHLPFDSKIIQSQTWTLACADTFVFAGQRGSGVFRISPNEKVWKRMVNGLKSKMIQDIMVINDTFYAATYGGFVVISTDYGENWTVDQNLGTIDDSLCYSLAHNSTYLFVGTAGRNWSADTGVVFRSRRATLDKPEKINNGLLKNGVHWEGCFSMDANDSLAFVGTDDVGVFRTTDNGNQWQSVSKLGGDIHSIKIAGNGYVYYGTSYGGIYSSSNNGVTWSEDNGGLTFGAKSLPYLVKDFILIDSFIYTATTIGIFRKVVPRRNSVEQIIELIKPLNKAIVSSNKDTLYWKEKNGVSEYRVQISERAEFFVKDCDTIVNNNYVLIPAKLKNDRNYFWRVRDDTNVGTWSDVWSFSKQLSTTVQESTNTYNNQVIIDYDRINDMVKITSNISPLRKISLINLQGENVKTIVGTIGDTSVQMDTSELASGVYFIIACDEKDCCVNFLQK